MTRFKSAKVVAELADVHLGPQAEAGHRFQRTQSTTIKLHLAVIGHGLPFQARNHQRTHLVPAVIFVVSVQCHPMFEYASPADARGGIERSGEGKQRLLVTSTEESHPHTAIGKGIAQTGFTDGGMTDCTSAQGLTHTQLNLDVRVHLHAPLRIPTLASAAFNRIGCVLTFHLQNCLLRLPLPAQGCHNAPLAQPTLTSLARLAAYMGLKLETEPLMLRIAQLRNQTGIFIHAEPLLTCGDAGADFRRNQWIQWPVGMLVQSRQDQLEFLGLGSIENQTLGSLFGGLLGVRRCKAISRLLMLTQTRLRPPQQSQLARIEIVKLFEHDLFGFLVTTETNQRLGPSQIERFILGFLGCLSENTEGCSLITEFGGSISKYDHAVVFTEFY